MIWAAEETRVIASTQEALTQISLQKDYKKGAENQEKLEVKQEKEASSYALVTPEKPEIPLGLLTKE